MNTRDLVHIALYAAVIAVLGLLPKFSLPLAGGVPITAQTLGVMLAGVMLGGWRGFLASALFLFVVALGAPLLAGGRGGLGVFAGPSAGFLLGWPFGALVTGLLMHRLTGLPIFAAGTVAAVVGGVFVVYAAGIPVLAWKADLSLQAAVMGSLGFMPGDIIKAVLVGLVARTVWRFQPEALLSRAG